jgi:PAS domain S-box-containing protein
MSEQPFSEDQRLTELSLLYEVTSIPAGLTDLNKVLDIVLEKACNRLGARWAAVYLISDQGGLQPRATRGVPLALLPPLSAADLRGPLADALEARKSRTWSSGEHATADDPLATYYPVSNAVYLPLVVGERLAGLLYIAHLKQRPFSDSDVSLFEALAARAATIIENIQLYDRTDEQLEQRVAELTALQRIGMALASTLDLEKTLRVVVEGALRLLPADDVFIHLYDAQRGDFIQSSSRWKDETQLWPASIPGLQDMALKIIQEKEPLIIHDAFSHPLFREPGVQSLAGFPLLKGKRPIGVLSVVFISPHHFTDSQIRVLWLLVDQVSNAIDSAQQYFRVSKYIHELTIFNEIGRVLVRSLELEQLLPPLANNLARMVDATGCLITQWNAHHRAARPLAVYGTSDEYSRLMPTSSGQLTLTEAVVLEGQPLIIENVREASFISPEVVAQLSDQSLLAVPLLGSSGFQGAIIIGERRYQRRFTDEEVQRVSVAARQVVLAIERARLYDESRAYARQLETLAVAAQKVGEELSLDETLAAIAQAVHDVLTCDRLAIWLIDANDEISCVYALGLSPQWQAELAQRYSARLFRRTFTYHNAWIVPDALSDATTARIRDWVEREGIRTSVAFPLLIQGKLIGVLSLFWNSVHYDLEQTRQLGPMLAAQAATAIQNARLYEQARQEIAQREQIGRALRESEERLRSTFASMDDLVFVLDKDGAFCDYYQPPDRSELYFPPEEFVGKSFEEVLPPNVSPLLENAIKALIETARVQQYDYSMELDGEESWFSAKISMRRDSSGEFAGVTQVSRNITARKRAEEEIRNLAKFPSENPSPVLRVVQDGTILYTNKAGAPLLDVWGSQVGERLPDDLGQLVLDILRSGENQDVEMECGDRTFSLMFAPMVDGNYVNIYGRDITESKRLEQMKTEFIANVSHELRTPLASIMGFIETLLSGRPGPLTDVQERFLQNSFKSSERLRRLVEELLMVSRIQRGILRLERHPFLPVLAIRNVQDMVSPLASARSIVLHVHDEWPSEERFIADQDRLEQVMTNLVSNAIKFTPEGGEVWVHSQKQANDWRFEVQDQGIGIPKEDLPLLFRRFYRASNAVSAQIQGTGLGLYVCKAIIDQHGGQIGVESELDVGTNVWFVVPNCR